MSEVNGVRLPFMPIGGLAELNKRQVADVNKNPDSEFSKIFQDELGKVKFSAHAMNRMQSRDISLNNDEISRLENAVYKADEKNARESLIMLDQKAFIVSIPSKTVITVVSPDKLDSSIITNIDSAVFA